MSGAVEPFEQYTDVYDSWFVRNAGLYEAELHAIKAGVASQWLWSRNWGGHRPAMAALPEHGASKSQLARQNCCHSPLRSLITLSCSPRFALWTTLAQHSEKPHECSNRAVGLSSVLLTETVRWGNCTRRVRIMIRSTLMRRSIPFKDPACLCAHLQQRRCPEKVGG
jgi:hypothetical protein